MIKDILFYNIMNIIKQENIPEDILQYIKEYIPLDVMVWLNRDYYTSYHNTIYDSINICESYIRMLIRGDKHYIFKMVLQDNIMRWYNMKKYTYKHMVFENYLNFLINYADENNSKNVKMIIENTCDRIIGKKWHKKNPSIIQ
jgi:hypothetical protein